MNRRSLKKVKNRTEHTDLNNVPGDLLETGDSYDQPEKIDSSRIEELKARIDRKVHARRRFYFILIILILLGSFLFLFFNFIKADIISVEGNLTKTDEYIVALSGIKPGDHIFSISKEEAASNLERDPFIRLLDIRYQFPNSIRIIVEERIPKASVLYGSQFVLIDKECHILSVYTDKDAYRIPVIEGIGLNSVELGFVLRTDESHKIDIIKDILHYLDLNSFTDIIKSIDLSNIDDITLYTRKGMTVIFGQDDKLNEKTAWAKAIIESLEKDGVETGVIDISVEGSAIYRKAVSAGNSTGTPEGSGEGV